MSSQTSILEGIRVIETASMVMVPSVGAIMAEYGAEVIKIEPPDGDLNRRGHLIPGMPDHDHGLPTQPQVTSRLENGDYLLEGVRFHMPGKWQLCGRFDPLARAP